MFRNNYRKPGFQSREKDTNFIFGLRPVIEAIEAGKDVDKILIKKGLSGELINELYAAIRERQVNYQLVPEEKLNGITRKNHQGVVAFISPVPLQKIEDIVPGLYEQGVTPFIVALDGVTDVRNLGSIARTAECAGVNAILLPEKGSAQLNADAMKTSSGALNYLPVCRTAALKKSLQFLRDSGIKLVAATEKAEQLYHKSDYTSPVCIVMGSEDTGIDPEILRICDDLVRLPVHGKISSLNVSNAAAVFFYEVVRQREEKSGKE
ncbi:MAG TPA: 23S rRNA (guanosine(2251)-2'-O)-methyltransferase RlmB [Bacteroidales bacterium]|nr:23S rRNA (guanosine(2251)-2'-O)-methyltransferase RlmB [Bacteroidales bacterium]